MFRFGYTCALVASPSLRIAVLLEQLLEDTHGPALVTPAKDGMVVEMVVALI